MGKKFFQQLEFNDLDDFKKQSKFVQPLFKNAKLPLNFDGYSKMINSYNHQMNVEDPDYLFELSHQLIFWINYFEDLHGCTHVLMKQKENQIEYMTAFRTQQHFNVDLEDKISCIEFQKKSFNSYEKVLSRQIKKMKIIYKNVFNSYTEAVKNLTYSKSAV